MVKEIKLYIEGSKSSKTSTITLREGFSAFFKTIVEKARQKKCKFQIVMSGSTSETLKDFGRSSDVAEVYRMVLVDSDGPIDEDESVKNFFAKRFPSWTSTAEEEQCHVMVQVMEAWFFADTDALSKYYGPSLAVAALFTNPKVESIPKKDVIEKLEKATKKSVKGPYHKTKHGPDLLAKIDTSKVKGASPRCASLFRTLEDKIRA